MPSLSSYLRHVVALLLATVVGCSSDKGSTLDPTESETPFQSGDLSGSLLGPLGAPTITSSPGATVNGLVGRFTSLVYHPGGASGSPLGSTPLFYEAAAAGQSHIWRINFDGSNAKPLTPDSADHLPTVDPVSGRVAFWREVAGSSPVYHNLYSMDQNGGDQTLLFGPVACIASRVEWAPSGNFLYDRCDTFLYETTLGNLLLPPTLGFSVVNSDAGQLAVAAREPFLEWAFRASLFTVTYPNRDTLTILTGEAADTFANPEVGRTAPTRLAYWRRTVPDTAWKLHVGLLSDPANTRPIWTSPPDTAHRAPCARWSPDGDALIVIAPDNTGVPQLTLIDTLGAVVRQITHQGGTGVLSCPGVGVPGSSGGNEPVVLVGDGGLIGATASGVVISQGASANLVALMAFRGAPQRSIRLEATTGLNSTAPALTYTLEANRLTSLAYTALPAADAVVQAIDSTSTLRATGALITFRAADGTVALVLPYAGDSNRTPQVSDGADSRTFRGPFLAAYDGRGRNLAPNGAAEAVLDLKTGSVRVQPDHSPR